MSLKLLVRPVRAAIVGTMLACGACGDAPSDAESSAASMTGVVATLSPSTDLVDGQEVTLTITGLADSEGASVRLCRLAPGGSIPVEERCPFQLGELLLPANGVIEHAFRIPASAAGVNCQLDACALYIDGVVLANPPFSRVQEVVPVSFRSMGEPPLAPPLSVTPSAGLADRQQVTVRGTAFLPNVFVTVGQCRAGAQSFEEDCMAVPTTPAPARTTASGELEVAATLRYRVEPSAGEPFDCTEGTCVVAAVPNRQSLNLAEAGRAPIVFDLVTNPGPVQRGTLQLDRASVTSGDGVLVTGSGWAPRATVQVNLCNTEGHIVCSRATSIQVAADGTFATRVTTGLLVVENAFGTNAGTYADCAASNTCAMRAADTRDLAATLVSEPLGIAVRPGVSAAFDLRAPHVAEMSVRIVGSGFTPNGSVDLWQCDDLRPGVPQCFRIGSMPTDTSGNLRGYARPLAGFRGLYGLDCVQSGSSCDLVITDGPGIAILPVRFTTGEEFDITSSYEAKWQPLLEQGLALSGASPAELQRHGASVLLWVMAASGAQSAAHFPARGNLSYTTTYPRQTYIEMTNLAASYDYTLDELQKAGTLFWSWVLAGQPPLPTGE